MGKQHTAATLDTSVDEIERAIKAVSGPDYVPPTPQERFVSLALMRRGTEIVGPDDESRSERLWSAYRARATCLYCGTWKGRGEAYCPECDAEAIVILTARLT